MISPTREPFGHQIPSGSFGRSYYSGAPQRLALKSSSYLGLGVIDSLRMLVKSQGLKLIIPTIDCL